MVSPEFGLGIEGAYGLAKGFVQEIPTSGIN
jgi:hypothetical protein